MDINQVKHVCPRANSDWVLAILGETLRWKVNNVNRLAMLFAQFAHETMGFTIFEENLNYSIPIMMRVWSARFPSVAAATPYEHRPEELANYIYADVNRNPLRALGNNQPGDGWRYRGRAVPQITGRANYHTCGNAIGQPLEEFPELLSRPSIGAMAGCWYWYSHGCNEKSDNRDLEGVTRAIAGGLIGLKERGDYFREFLAVVQPEAE